MKKLLFSLSLLMMFSVVFIACDDDDDDRQISFDELPTNTKTFLDTHFNGQTIRYIEKDNDSYDVYLNTGFEIEFGLSGDWDDIDGVNQAVPESVLALVPTAIIDYISANYPDLSVYELNKEHFGYEIELSNRVELEFDKDGNFLRIDN